MKNGIWIMELHNMARLTLHIHDPMRPVLPASQQAGISDILAHHSLSLPALTPHLHRTSARTKYLTHELEHFIIGVWKQHNKLVLCYLDI